MQETTNYKLKKIELSDSPPDITVINPNWDLIDSTLKEVSNKSNLNEDEVALVNDLITQLNQELSNHNHDSKYLGKTAKAADSDKLDGYDSSFFTNILARLGYTPLNKAGDTMTGPLKVLHGYIGDVYVYNDTTQDNVVFRTGNATDGYSYIKMDRTGLYFNGIKVWHAGNDGSGSGLDADLLDGKHSNQFFEKSSSGSLLNITGTDLNQLSDSGFYNGTNLANAPSGALNYWWYVEVFTHVYSINFIFQRATNLNGDDKSYYRICKGGTWGEWYEIFSSNSLADVTNFSVAANGVVSWSSPESDATYGWQHLFYSTQDIRDLTYEECYAGTYGATLSSTLGNSLRIPIGPNTTYYVKSFSFYEIGGNNYHSRGVTGMFISLNYYDLYDAGTEYVYWYTSGGEKGSTYFKLKESSGGYFSTAVDQLIDATAYNYLKIKVEAIAQADDIAVLIYGEEDVFLSSKAYFVGSMTEISVDISSFTNIRIKIAANTGHGPEMHIHKVYLTV